MTDQTRRHRPPWRQQQILRLIEKGPISRGEIMEKFGLTERNADSLLHIMKNRGLVTSTLGRNSRYTAVSKATSAPLAEIVKVWG